MLLRPVLALWALGRLARTAADGRNGSASRGVTRHPIQIIGAGLSRTATQSLALALTELGFKTLHAEGFHPEIPLGRGTPLTATITAAARRYFEGEGFQALDPALQLVSDLSIDAVVDLPWSECAPELIQRHPRAKVIVTVRDDAAGWYRSYWEHFRSHASLHRLLAASDEQDRVSFRHAVAAVVPNGAREGAGRGVGTTHSKADCIQAYDRRIEHLKSIVPRESLLIFNVKKGWGPLCSFLGRKVPRTSFPRNDAYTFLHWHAGPSAFLAAVYTAYGAILCGCAAFARWLWSRSWSRRRDLARKRA